MRRTYAAQRGVSQGASVTLAAVFGSYQARFECAQRAAQVLGHGALQDGHFLFIATEDVYRTVTKLTETLSVALVDTVTDDKGSRFVLVWRITPTRKEVEVSGAPTDELDEY
jgi:hypothetical protein